MRHHPALPFDEIAAFMAELRARDGVSARALEVTISTALRTGEVIKAQWDQIGLVNTVWTVPAARMKAKKEHRIPLPDGLTDILIALPREGTYVFIGGRSGAPLSSTAMLELLRGMRPGLTVHGFRSTFRDWAAELTNYPNHVVEMALAHAIGDKVEAAYRRGNLFDKRRQLMTAWSRYCQQKPIAKPSDNGNVIPIRSDAS